MWLKTKDKKGKMVERKKPCILRMMFTKTLLPMYIIVLAVNVTFIIYYWCSGNVTP